MREVGYSLRAYLTHRLALCSIAPLNERRISGSAERPNWNPMSQRVISDRAIQRQSRPMSALRRKRPSAIPRQADAMYHLADVLVARLVPLTWRVTLKRLRRQIG